MHSFLLSKIIIPLQLVFIALYMVCRQMGAECITSYLPLPIFVLTLIEVMLLFPAAKKGEDDITARERVRTQLLRDPILYIGIAALLFIIVQTLNGPKELVYSRILKSWTYTEGSISYLPASLDPILSIQSAFWVLIISTALLAIRNACSKKARILTLKLICALASLVALYALAKYSLSDKTATIAAFTNFATPAEAGIFFYTATCLTIGLIFYEMRQTNRASYSLRLLLIAFVLNFIAALYSLDPIIVALLLGSLSLIIIYAFISFIVMPSGELRLTSFATLALLIGAFVFFHYVAYPKNRIHDCIDQISAGEWRNMETKLLDDTTEKIAWRIFADNTATGIGTWCIGHPNGMAHYIEGDEWNIIKDPEVPNYYANNDTAQLLAETGIIGTSLIALPYLYIAIITLIKIYLLAKNGTAKKLGLFRKKSKDIESLNVFNIIPAHIFAIIVVTIATYAVSFHTSVLHSPVNLYIWSMLIALSSTLLLTPAASTASNAKSESLS